MTRKEENRRISPLAPTARGCGKLEEYVAKMRNFDLEAIEAKSRFGYMSDVTGVSFSKQERGATGLNNIDDAMASLEDMLTN